jgi:hypothetical protein
MPVQFLHPDFIRVTAEYSNAVLFAILPYVSDCCQKMNVQIPTPITIQQVKSFHCSSDRNNPGGGVVLTNGCIVTFSHGVVDTFVDRHHSFRCMEDERLRPRFYGYLTITNKDQALALARDGLRKLGFSLVDVFADGEPSSFVAPRKEGTNIIPYYEIDWNDPRGYLSATVEVDGQSKRLTEVAVCCSTSWKPSLTISTKPEGSSIANVRTSTSTVALTNTLSRMSPRVADYAKIFGVPVSLPLTTNDVEAFDAKRGGIFGISLKGGYDFSFKDEYIFAFNAPNSFYQKVLESPVQQYWGQWNMSERDAVKLSRQFLDRLHYWHHPCLYDKIPDVKRPMKAGLHTIPRYQIVWEHDLPKVDVEIPVDEYATVEIDADTKSVKSFSVFCAELMSQSPR